MKIKWIAIGGASLTLASQAFAATTPNSWITPQTPNIGTQAFIQGTDSTGTFKPFYTGGANGSKCFAMMLNTNDQATTHLVSIEIVHTTSYVTATYLTVINSTGLVYGPSINLLSSANWAGLPTDLNGNPFIFLTSGDTLKANYLTALNTSAQINIVAYCGDF